MNVNGRYIMAHVTTWCKLGTTLIHGSHVFLLVLGSFFMIYGFIFCCIGGFVVIVGNNSCENLIHCLCQIVEGLNHSHAHGHLWVVGSFILDFEILNWFFNKSILGLCSFLLQHYICGIDSINRFHQNLTPFLCCFCHALMNRRVCFLHPCASTWFSILCFWNVWMIIDWIEIGVVGLILGGTSFWLDSGMVVLFENGTIHFDKWVMLKLD